MERFLQDFRFAVRVLFKDRAFTLTTLLTLAVCIGANAAVFAIVHAILLRPLPVPGADRIMLLYNSYPKAGVARASTGVPDYYDRLRETDVSTYGGNLLACRAAIVFLDELTKHGLMDHVASVGRHAESALRAMASRLPAVRDVRGAGLIWGIDLDRPAAPVVEAALERGLLINRTSDTVIRLLPPYVITASELDEGIAILEEAIAARTQGGQA